MTHTADVIHYSANNCSPLGTGISRQSLPRIPTATVHNYYVTDCQLLLAHYPAKLIPHVSHYEFKGIHVSPIASVHEVVPTKDA